MIEAARQSVKCRQPKLRLHKPNKDQSGHIRYWRINGFLASIRCWTDQEYQALRQPPPNAVLYPEGVWVQLEWAAEPEQRSARKVSKTSIKQ